MYKALSTFLFHQLIGAEGVTVICTLTVSFLFSMLREPPKEASWILTELPGFPIQVVSALIGGFVLWKVFRHPAMIYVWILPLSILCCLFLVLVCVRGSIPAAAFRHFFGNTCHPSSHCFDQVVFALPVMTSAAYAVGAFLAKKFA
jgi:hypothetical protein